jgi:hypothetical protein
MASLSDLVSAGSLKPMGVLATVDRAPSDADDTLDVLYTTDAGSDADEKALRWASRGGVLPAEGDDVLLFLDSLGDPWGIVWPSGATPDVPDVSGSLLALDARLDALEANRTVHGIIDATSGTPSIVKGTGFTITDNGVGDYTINFNVAFGDVPSVVITGRRSASGVGNITKLHPVTAPTASAARVQSFRYDTGAMDDVEFHFIAEGPA